MEYYYDKYKKVWRDIDRKECSPDKARSLEESQKKIKDILLLENRRW